MVLKHIVFAPTGVVRFRSLQTYMVLKQRLYLYKPLVVLDPYKLTWFSNWRIDKWHVPLVLDPYKLTWFSNGIIRMHPGLSVLDPYKLTWFSNIVVINSNIV